MMDDAPPVAAAIGPFPRDDRGLWDTLRVARRVILLAPDISDRDRRLMSLALEHVNRNEYIRTGMLVYWIGPERLAVMAGCCRKTAQRARQKLEKAGALVWAGGGGRGRGPRRYALVPGWVGAEARAQIAAGKWESWGVGAAEAPKGDEMDVTPSIPSAATMPVVGMEKGDETYVTPSAPGSDGVTSIRTPHSGGGGAELSTDSVDKPGEGASSARVGMPDGVTSARRQGDTPVPDRVTPRSPKGNELNNLNQTARARTRHEDRNVTPSPAGKPGRGTPRQGEMLYPIRGGGPLTDDQDGETGRQGDSESDTRSAGIPEGAADDRREALRAVTAGAMSRLMAVLPAMLEEITAEVAAEVLDGRGTVRPAPVAGMGRGGAA